MRGRQVGTFLSQEICCFLNADELNSIQFSAGHHGGDKQTLMSSGDTIAIIMLSTRNTLIPEKNFLRLQESLGGAVMF